jgi:hypothetical protein
VVVANRRGTENAREECRKLNHSKVVTMDPANPLSILTFIVAPAILTNASSIMALGTSNRFARAIDRARALSAEVKNREDASDPESALRVRQLRAAEQRVLMLVRSLAAFYLSVGCFAAASLTSLLAAIGIVMQQSWLQQFSLVTALCAGVLGVVGLVSGSALLVWESRLALRILTEETKFLREQTR